jgi:hypothetical protein
MCTRHSGEQPLQDIWFVAFLATTAMVLSVFKPWGRVREQFGFATFITK